MTHKFDDTRNNHERHYGSFEKDASDEGINQRVQVKNGPDEPVYVEILDDGAGGTVKNVYAEVSDVTSGSETLIVSYTVPVGKTFYLKEIHGSGDNRARFTVEIDSSNEGRERTYPGQFNVNFRFYNYAVTAGKIIRLKVLHSRSATNEFDGRIIGNEI